MKEALDVSVSVKNIGVFHVPTAEMIKTLEELIAEKVIYLSSLSVISMERKEELIYKLLAFHAEIISMLKLRSKDE
jgi:hypothetical protein